MEREYTALQLYRDASFQFEAAAQSEQDGNQRQAIYHIKQGLVLAGRAKEIVGDAYRVRQIQDTIDNWGDILAQLTSEE